MNSKIAGYTIFTVLAGSFLLLALNILPPALSGTQIVPCREPLTYRFGDIDPRFNIKKAALANIMEEVESLWRTALNKDLLTYSENGEVMIYLRYGDEQERTEEERSLSRRIQSKQAQVELLQDEYDRLAKSFEKQKGAFESSLNQFNNAVDTYNERLNQWDNWQNIPSDKQQDLKQMQQQINRQQIDLNRKQQNLESLRKRTNAKSKRLNQMIDEQNRLVEEYNRRFSKPHKFDQGRYVREGKDERINIYQFSNKAELKTVLAHEAGHALGLDHVENSESVMYPMMGAQNIFDLSLTMEDIAAIKELCNE